MEEAKRRLFYSLIKLRLPLPTPGSGDPQPLVFDFLADPPDRKEIMTGHEHGAITISLTEADDSERERYAPAWASPIALCSATSATRSDISTGIAWSAMPASSRASARYSATSGRTTGDALNRYYASGPAPNWQASYVSAYATMHPWEDFAETWAHYLHTIDTLEMAYAFSLSVAPRVGAEEGLERHRRPQSLQGR